MKLGSNYYKGKIRQSERIEREGFYFRLNRGTALQEERFEERFKWSEAMSYPDIGLRDFQA